MYNILKPLHLVQPEEEEEEVVVHAQKVQSRGAVVSYGALPPKPSFKPVRVYRVFHIIFSGSTLYTWWESWYSNS